MELQVRRVDPELLGQGVLVASGDLQALGGMLEDLVARRQDLRVFWRALDARQDTSAPSLRFRNALEGPRLFHALVRRHL